MAKTVLFITRKWPPAVGGMETYCRHLSQELACLTDVETIALPGRADGRPPSILSLLWFGFRTSLKALSTTNQYDVIHGGDLAVWPLVWLAGLRAPRHARLILSAHGSDIAYANRKGLLPFLYRTYLNLAARLLKDARILANSHATAALCKARGFQSVAVIPLAADIPAQNASCPAPEPYILFVGRLTKQKGCGWFIKNVLPLLPSQIRLKVAGTIIEDEERAALADDRVDYLGPVFGEDLRRLRSRALAVIAPNIITGPDNFEGFGLTALEGAADCGVVVASSLFGLTDAVSDNVTGYLLPAGDPQAWRRKLLEIHEWPLDQRSTFLSGALEHVRKHYTWPRLAAATYAAYDQDGLTSAA